LSNSRFNKALGIAQGAKALLKPGSGYSHEKSKHAWRRMVPYGPKLGIKRREASHRFSEMFSISSSCRAGRSNLHGCATGATGAATNGRWTRSRGVGWRSTSSRTIGVSKTTLAETSAGKHGRGMYSTALAKYVADQCGFGPPVRPDLGPLPATTRATILRLWGRTYGSYLRLSHTA
jgi:hypothetical protein